MRISYLRSIHKANIRKCSDLNVFSGSNDVGKSNILKALNLFFNGDVDWGGPFRFEQDFSVRRRTEVKQETVKGKQFISIALDLCPPRNFSGSLPANVTVTRTWARDSAGQQYQQKDDLETRNDQNQLPSTLETARRQLTGFLRRTHFEYVPAVKERLYFTQLLSRLQNRLLDRPLGERLGSVATDLAKRVGADIHALTREFGAATDVAISIEPPHELSSLFRAFQVITGSENDGKIPLFLHGDGIQGRFVPSVLHYIAQVSSDFFIWGFEEPETCLEYGRVEQLARDFLTTYSGRAQIFLSTHSPGFVCLEGDQVACYRVFREDESTVVTQVYPRLRGNDAPSAALRSDLGMLKIQQEVHREYEPRLRALESENENLRAVSQEMERARQVLLVEGKHDVGILTHAWKVLFGVPLSFAIVDADPTGGHSGELTGGGGGGAAAVARALDSARIDRKLVVGLFDNDTAGVSAFTKLSKNFIADGERRKKHRNGQVWALLLPIPTERADYAAAGNLSIEFLFPDEVLALRSQDGRGLEFEDDQVTLSVGGKQLPLSQLSQETRSALPQSLPGYRRIRGGKKTFAEQIVPALIDPESFAWFRPLLLEVCQMMGTDTDELGSV